MSQVLNGSSMPLLIKKYDPSMMGDWDQFCHRSYQATFLHEWKYLSYHGDRFKDQSLMIYEDNRLLGLLPCAEHPGDPECVVSHPGVTYGGILHQGRLSGSAMVAALDAVISHLKCLGYKRFVYKAVPTFYHRHPAQDDIYAIYRLGGVLSRCDISTVIDLSGDVVKSSRRKRSLNSAIKNGVVVNSGINYLPELWDVLAENLMRKHGVKPVHTIEEITRLATAYPENIQCIVGLHREMVVAGILQFSTDKVCHSQYIASSPAGYELSALDAVFDFAILSAKENKKCWFDFGISTENNGLVLNAGLYEFKTEFGGGGFVHQFYEFDLLKDRHVS